MGHCFLLNDVFLIMTSVLGVIPGCPGLISFSEFVSYLVFDLIIIFLAWRRCGIRSIAL